METVIVCASREGCLDSCIARRRRCIWDVSLFNVPYHYRLLFLTAAGIYWIDYVAFLFGLQLGRVYIVFDVIVRRVLVGYGILRIDHGCATYQDEKDNAQRTQFGNPRMPLVVRGTRW